MPGRRRDLWALTAVGLAALTAAGLAASPIGAAWVAADTVRTAPAVAGAGPRSVAGAGTRDIEACSGRARAIVTGGLALAPEGAAGMPEARGQGRQRDTTFARAFLACMRARGYDGSR